MEYTDLYDVAIIGGGPAGLTAAIYVRRANFNVCYIEKGAPGGKVTTTSFVENYPGFESIDGPDLSLKWFEQAQKLGIKQFGGEVVNIIAPKDDEYRYVILKRNRIIKAKAVIIATGMVNRLLEIPGEKEYEHKGISYCCICDGSIYKDQIVSIIGSGRSAVEEGIYMSDIAKKVYIISNKKEFKAEQGIVDALIKKENVEVLFDTDTLAFEGDNEHLTNLLLRNKTTNEEFKLDVNGSFTFIGFLPVAPTVNDNSILDEVKRFIIVDANMKTKIPGIFAAGDIVDKSVRQIATAIGDGAIAGLSAIEYISKKTWQN